MVDSLVDTHEVVGIAEIAEHEDLNNFFLRFPDDDYTVDHEGNSIKETYGIEGGYLRSLCIENGVLEKPHKETEDIEKLREKGCSELYLRTSPLELFKLIDSIIRKEDLMEEIQTLQRKIGEARKEYRFNDLAQLQQTLNSRLRPVYVQLREQGYSREDLAL